MKIKELQDKSYEELVQLQQDGDITIIEFIKAQSDLADKWKEWIDTRPINEQSAKAFLAWYDNHVMDHQEIQVITPQVRIGKKIAELRKEKGYSQFKLSQLTGIDSSNIGKIELGKYNSSLEILSRIGDVLGVELDFVVK